MHKRFATLAFLSVLCASGGLVLASDALVVVDPSAEGVTAPYLIPASRVSPSYPPAALQARYDGAVLLRATVLANGTVGSVDVLESTRGKLGFEKSAMRAVEQWRFEPATLDGANVASYALVRIRFNPPQRNGLGGFVTGEFPSTSAIAAAERDARLSMAGLGELTLPPLPYDPNANHTAISDTQSNRMATYGKPPCATGCLYNREELIPPSTYGFAVVGQGSSR
jgi:protein TonB